MVKIPEATESSNSKKLLGLYYKNCHFSALQVIWLFTQVHLIIRSLVIFLLKEIWNVFLVFFYLDLFGMNSTLDNNLRPDNNLSIPRIQSHYFSPHSLNQYSRCLNKDRLENSLAIVHNNTTSLNRNLEKITSHYLDELR